MEACVSRPAVTLNPLFLNVSPRPVISSRTMPRIVRNVLAVRYKKYRKNADGWPTDFPTDTANITWGYDVDGGQWFEFTSTAGDVQRVWAVGGGVPVKTGQKVILSWTVDSKSGTFVNQNVLLSGVTFSGTGKINNPAVGRHRLAVTATADGNMNCTFGIGLENSNNNNATIRMSNVMMEIPTDQTRTIPYEYVTPEDMRAFPYTYSVDVTGTLLGTPVLGTPYAFPDRCSVLCIGDSFGNDVWSTPPNFGDYPFQLRRIATPGSVAVNARHVSGQNIEQITALLQAAMAETDYTAGAAPYKICVCEGGIINVTAGHTLAQIQAYKLAQIDYVRSLGMQPILFGIGPLDNTSANNNTMIANVNA